MAAILQMWPGAKIDAKDPAGIWGASVNDLSTEQIRYGIQQMARTPKEYPVNPGQFRAMAMAYRSPPPRRVNEIDDYSAKTQAWRACQARFAMELCGQSPATAPQTDFPVSIVLADVPIDREARKAAIAGGFHVNHRFDQGLFDRLKTAFERRWSQL